MAKFEDGQNNVTSWDEVAVNRVRRDLRYRIESSGQIIDDNNDNQGALAQANYSACGTYYTETGIVNAYVLQTVTPFLAPSGYKDGMIVRFRTGNANTGASTIDVANKGVKAIKEPDGLTDIPAGRIKTATDTVLRFDFDNDCFIVSNAIDTASETAEGLIELATQSEVDTGTDGVRAITPATLVNSVYSPTKDLETQVISSPVGAVQFLDLANYTGFRYLKLEMTNVVPASADARIYVQFSNDNGSSWITTAGYRFIVTGYDDTPDIRTYSSNGFNSFGIYITEGGDVGVGVGLNTTNYNGEFEIYNNLNASVMTACKCSFGYRINGNEDLVMHGFGSLATAEVNNAFRIIGTTGGSDTVAGNISSGTFKLIGVK